MINKLPSFEVSSAKNSTQIISFDESIKLPSKFSKHYIEKDHWLVIAPEQALWFSTDGYGLTLFESFLQGMSPKEAIINLCTIYHVPADKAFVALQDLFSQLNASFLLDPKSWQDEKDIIPTMHIYLTQRCNLRCLHCYRYTVEHNNIDYSRELSTNEVLSIFEEFTKITQESNITLSGGEPLMRSDILQLAQRAHSLGHHVALFTNGLLLNQETINKLKPFIESIQISLDGATPMGHDALRGSGTFKDTCRAIHLVADSGIPLDISITVTPINAYDLLENYEVLETFLENINAHTRIAVVNLSGRARQNWTEEQVRRKSYTYKRS